MKLQLKTKMIDLMELSANPSSKQWIAPAKFIMTILGMAFCLAVPSAGAQNAIRFVNTVVRVTVPVGTTNSMTITNQVVLVNGASNAFFDVSGLPAGASAIVTDTNGTPLSFITNSAAVWLTVNTTNIAQGLYNFTLDAGGVDTNGVPITNSMTFVLQSARVWKGGGLGVAGFAVSNNVANASSWIGGVVPGPTDDVVFGDSGAQTNNLGNSGISFTNIGIDANLTVASIRFAQNTFTNTVTTNTLYHTIKINNGSTLSITGTNGFTLLRDTIGENGYVPDNTMGVNIVGTNGTLSVNNPNANFSVLLGSGEQPSLSLSNLGTFVTSVSRVGIGDYLLYPNYRAINNAYNGGRDTNTYSGFPRRFTANFFFARTNVINASYLDANNYTNEFTRSYGVMLFNNEQNGVGSSTAQFCNLGVSNRFNADGVCLIGSSASSTAASGVRFGFGKFSTAYFRGTNGGRMSVFTIADEGTGTNEAASNMKAFVDFSGPTNYVDILADRFYISRDRTLIQSNQTPNIQGDLTIGWGNVDVNTAVLGFQEHSNKIDWTTIGGAQAYLGYCEGRMVLTNSGSVGQFGNTFKVNGNLTLGYTADRNPSGSAQQYNTYGQITLYSNATLIASNIICDGGLNFYDGSGRKNTITINRGGNLIVSNTVGFYNFGDSDVNGFSAAGPNGMLLDTLTMTAGTLSIPVSPLKTNVYVRSLLTPGLIPSVITVLGVTGVSSYPVQIPVISYQGSASPFLNANVTSLGAGYFGYVLNNALNQTVDVYITTNQPNNLIWTGSINNTWDTSTRNWVTAVGGVQTNFNLGDAVTFNDNSTVTNVNIDGSVVPSQTGIGVTISNSVNQYTFSGGTIAGTAQISKLGTNILEMDATEQGPISVLAGSLVGSGAVGTTTLASNVVMTYSGTINGGLTSTGMVFLTAGTLTGPVSIQGGSLVNSATINTTVGQIITMAGGVSLTNIAGGIINVGVGGGNNSTMLVPNGATLANFGTINLYQPQLIVEGLLFGNGTIRDPNGGGYDGILNPGTATLVRIQNNGVISPSFNLAPYGSISNMNLQCRFDFENDPTSVKGVGTVRIEVDFSNPQTNDVLNADRWNDCTGFLLITNINPGAGSFALGQVFQVLNGANSGVTPNFIDTPGFAPTIQPYVPGPGLQWGISNYTGYGSISVGQSPLVWDGSGNGSWDTNGSTSNWKSGLAYSDNQGAVFDDRASGTTAVNLTSFVAPDNYIRITNLIPNITNIVVGISTNITVGSTNIFTNTPAFSPGIVVSNATKDYVFSGPGRISGITGLYKTGSGRLTLMTTNDFNGNVIVDQGTLAVTNAGNNPAILSLGVAGGGQMKNDLILDGGKLDYIGSTNAAINTQGIIFNPQGATIGVASNGVVFYLSKGPQGYGTLTKTGPGTLALNGGNAMMTNNVIVSGGTLRLNAGNTIGFGSLILNNNVNLEVSTNLFFTFTNTLNVAGSGVGINILGAVTNNFSGPWTGAGSVTFSNTGPFYFSGDLSGFSGTISFGATSANYLFNNRTNNNPCTGSAAATFDLGTGSTTLSNMNGGGLTYNLGALAGGPNTVLAGRYTNNITTNANCTYSIGANGSSTTFSGKIVNGFDVSSVVSVVKVGTGRLLLNGISTYTGSTTVSNGVLGGTGSIAGPLNVVAGGTLSPGASIGTFTVSNNVTLGGTVLMELNQANSPGNSDLLVVTGTLTGGGTLVVTNIGPDIFNGTKFTLFSKPVTGLTVFLPASNPTNTSSYVWQNDLSTDGSITLVSGGTTVNTSPTSIMTGLTNNVLTLSWPSDHTGWRLLVQTNPLSVGLYTNWFTVVGSSSTNSVMVPIDSNNGSVFYRLVYP